MDHCCTVGPNPEKLILSVEDQTIKTYSVFLDGLVYLDGQNLRRWTMGVDDPY